MINTLALPPRPLFLLQDTSFKAPIHSQVLSYHRQTLTLLSDSVLCLIEIKCTLFSSDTRHLPDSKVKVCLLSWHLIQSETVVQQCLVADRGVYTRVFSPIRSLAFRSWSYFCTRAGWNGDAYFTTYRHMHRLSRATPTDLTAAEVISKRRENP